MRGKQSLVDLHNGEGDVPGRKGLDQQQRCRAKPPARCVRGGTAGVHCREAKHEQQSALIVAVAAGSFAQMGCCEEETKICIFYSFYFPGIYKMCCFVGKLFSLFLIGVWDVRKHSDLKPFTVGRIHIQMMFEPELRLSR